MSMNKLDSLLIKEVVNIDYYTLFKKNTYY